MPQKLQRSRNLSRNFRTDVYIAIAGLAAHLPGYITARTKKPVIGVPVNKAIGGFDALLSIVQMPKGVPVACVGIDNAENAPHLAHRILELTNRLKVENTKDRS